jgi:hypothetical protein
LLFKLFKVNDPIANLSTIDIDIFLSKKPNYIPNAFYFIHFRTPKAIYFKKLEGGSTAEDGKG